MCFSASASFGAGIIIAAVGIASIKKVQDRSQILFACIPLIFAVHQICEGFIWLSLTNDHYAWLQPHIITFYMFIAQVLWPVWIPLAVFSIESDEKYFRSQKILVGIGIGIALVTAYCLAVYDVNLSVHNHHIYYQADFPSLLQRWGGIPYFMATVFPLFFSSIKKMWWIGIGIVISYIVSAVFFKQYMVSIWCYFAAIVSISILMVLIEYNNARVKTPVAKIV